MYIKSSFPDPPKAPNCNAYQVLWNRPEQAEWPEDFMLYIDGKTGKKRTYQEFRTRVLMAATALGTPVSDGGLGISSESGGMIAIISANSLVRNFFPQRWTLFLFTTKRFHFRIMLYSFIRYSFSRHRSQ